MGHGHSIAARQPTVLADRYTLHEVIGRGGMADVYRGWDTVLGRQVAIKILRTVTDDPGDRARFAAEARMIARLSHPGLVTVLDAGTGAGTGGERPYLVMEFVPGTTMAGRCRAGGLDPAYVATVGAQLADALSYVHERGIVHRDIKPANVLLREDDRVLLADFGIARLTTDAARHTAGGLTIGTAAYLAPEQARGADVGPWTDVFSLGLVLLEALTGEPAYPGTPAETMAARLSGPPAIPEELPGPWRDLLRRMTVLDPADRPTAHEVRRALGELATETDASRVTAVLPTIVALSRRWSLGPYQRLVLAGALPGLLVLAVLLWKLGDPRVPAEVRSGPTAGIQEDVRVSSIPQPEPTGTAQQVGERDGQGDGQTGGNGGTGGQKKADRGNESYKGNNGSGYGNDRAPGRKPPGTHGHQKPK